MFVIIDEFDFLFYYGGFIAVLVVRDLLNDILRYLDI